jgi:hypothetical protein
MAYTYCSRCCAWCACQKSDLAVPNRFGCSVCLCQVAVVSPGIPCGVIAELLALLAVVSCPSCGVCWSCQTGAAADHEFECFELSAM